MSMRIRPFFLAPALLLWAFALVGCPSRPQPPAPIDPASQARIEKLVRSLDEAGLEVTRVEPMTSRREFPGCAEAEFRTRLHLGPGRFVNVSRFDDPGQAEACLEEFKEVALRAGPEGWERLGPTLTTRGRWLYVFPQDLTDPNYRAKVVEALSKVE